MRPQLNGKAQILLARLLTLAEPAISKKVVNRRLIDFKLPLPVANQVGLPPVRLTPSKLIKPAARTPLRCGSVFSDPKKPYRIHVLDYGRTIADGKSDTVLSDPNVLVAYLGTETIQSTTA